MAKAKPTVKLKVDSDDSQIITALLTCVAHCARCVSQVHSAFKAPCWHLKLAFPLRFPSAFFISSPLLALETHIPAAFPKRILHFKSLAGTRNSHPRCVSQVHSAFQAFGWHSIFAFTLRFPNEFCISRLWLALRFGTTVWKMLHSNIYICPLSYFICSFYFRKKTPFFLFRPVSSFLLNLSFPPPWYVRFILQEEPPFFLFLLVSLFVPFLRSFFITPLHFLFQEETAVLPVSSRVFLVPLFRSSYSWRARVCESDISVFPAGK